MNRKMTLLALPLKCWGLGESGLAEGASGAGALAKALPEKKPARSSRPERATPVKPAPACQRNSRRVRPQKVFEGLFDLALIGLVPNSYLVSAPLSSWHGHPARAGDLENTSFYTARVVRTGRMPVPRS